MSRDIRQPLAGAATALACAAIGAGWLWSGTEITPTDGRGNTTSAIADDPIVPEVRNPYDPSRSAATVAFWERKAAGDAQGAIARRELAGAYLARGRETGDIADAVKAEAAARESLKILPRNNANAMIRLARALLGQHRFPEAREVAERAEKLDPEAARLRADIDLELGRVAEAKLALAAIPDTPDDLNRIALQCRISLAEGRNFEATALLEGAARRADAQMDMAHEAVAWYHTMVGHLNIDAGRLDLGEQACRAALAVFPRDYRAMTGMAEAAVFRGDWASAREWCRQALVIGPQNPEALRLLGEAHAALGQKAEAEAAYGRFASLARSFPRIYDRHWIVFCADEGRDLDEALAMARADLALRPDAGAHDTLAWACLKKGLVREARAESALALAGGTNEAPLLRHASLIAKADGDEAAAKGLLDRARAANPYLMKDIE